MKPLLFLALSLLTLTTAVAQRGMKIVGGSATGKRTALVIGNAGYTHVGTLRNPLNDARNMSDALRALGFTVTQRTNLDRVGLEQTINDWGRGLTGSEVALFYYAGHGIEVNGINYLIPTDANPQNQMQVRFQAMPVETVTGWMELARVSTNIVLLDACRNNPFTWSRSTDDGGLANMSAPSGTFIGFAASPGKKAADGVRTNGLYTEAILRHLLTPGLTIDQVFNRVNQYVRQQSGGAQVPFKNSSLEDDFIFIPGNTTPDPKPEPTQPVSTGTVIPGPTPAPVATTTMRTRQFLDLPFASMAYVEGGTFQMGDTRGEGNDNEKPVHSVTVSSFWMSQYEITQRQWESVMGSNPSHFKDCPDCPVEQVSWDDVKIFLEKLNSLGVGTYRLPTEAEWEYAAGGGNMPNRSRFGNGQDVLDPAQTNFDGRADSKKTYSLVGDYPQKTVQVGSFSPNRLGLYDMVGNVYEWCRDWYWHGAYSESTSTNPSGSTWGLFRVLRGGSWHDDPVQCRTAHRINGTPAFRSNFVGFRVVSQ